jgi:hypothetical protein
VAFSVKRRGQDRQATETPGEVDAKLPRKETMKTKDLVWGLIIVLVVFWVMLLDMVGHMAEEIEAPDTIFLPVPGWEIKSKHLTPNGDSLICFLKEVPDVAMDSIPIPPPPDSAKDEGSPGKLIGQVARSDPAPYLW